MLEITVFLFLFPILSKEVSSDASRNIRLPAQCERACRIMKNFMAAKFLLLPQTCAKMVNGE